jgi:hypothetical protein
MRFLDLVVLRRRLRERVSVLVSTTEPSPAKYSDGTDRNILDSKGRKSKGGSYSRK